MTASVLSFDQQHHYMTPGGYGSPPALFSGVAPYVDAYYPGMQVQGPGPTAAVADPAYAAGSLFGTPPPAASGAAGYLYQSPAGAGALGAAADDIRTVFISGLPHDVKERELHNLLRFMPGYEASQMNWKTGGPQGFALFSTGAHARAMVDILSGLQFDDGVLLRAEMAHKNMFIKVRGTAAVVSTACRVHAGRCQHRLQDACKHAVGPAWICHVLAGLPVTAVGCKQLLSHHSSSCCSCARLCTVQLCWLAAGLSRCLHTATASVTASQLSICPERAGTGIG